MWLKHLLYISLDGLIIDHLVFDFNLRPIHFLKLLLVVPHVIDPEPAHHLFIPLHLIHLVLISDPICNLLFQLLCLYFFIIELVLARAFLQYLFEVQELMRVFIHSDLFKDLLLVDDVLFLEQSILLLVCGFGTDCVHLKLLIRFNEVIIVVDYYEKLYLFN